MSFKPTLVQNSAAKALWSGFWGEKDGQKYVVVEHVGELRPPLSWFLEWPLIKVYVVQLLQITETLNVFLKCADSIR